MFYKLSTVLNGTIKAIVSNPKTTYYQNCLLQCSDDQLIAIQMTSGILTNSPIFFKINMQKKTREVVKALPA